MSKRGRERERHRPGKKWVVGKAFCFFLNTSFVCNNGEKVLFQIYNCFHN